MPITGTFAADFSSFYDAVTRAQVELRGFEDSSAKVERSLDRMVDSLSGRKAISDATLIAEAVERIGGVAKLTEAELARLSPRVSEAVSKMKALGVDVPRNMEEIAAKTSGATSAASGLLSIGTQLASVFGVSFSVAGLVNLYSSAADAADELLRLSNITSLSTDDIQKLQAVSASTSVSMENLTGAVSYLQSHLDDAGFDDKVRKMGISFEALRSAEPYEQLRMIARAAAEIKDPVERANKVTEIFGKSGAQLLPALRANWDELTKGVNLAGRDQLEAIDNLSVGMGQKFAGIKTQFMAGIGAMAQAVEQLKTASLWDNIQIAFSPGAGVMENLARARQEVINLGHAADRLQTFKPVPLAPPDLPAMERYRMTLDGLTDEIRELTAEEKAVTAQGLALGQSNSEVAKGLGVNVESVNRYTEALQREKKSQEEAADAAKKHAEELEKQQKKALEFLVKALNIQDEIAADRASETATQTEKEIAAIHAWAQTQRDAVAGAEGDWSAYYAMIGEEESRRLTQVGINWDQMKGISIRDLQDVADRAEKTYQYMLAHSNEYTAGDIANSRQRAEAARAALDPMAAQVAAMNKANEDEINALYAAWEKAQAAAANAGNAGKKAGDDTADGLRKATGAAEGLHRQLQLIVTTAAEWQAKAVSLDLDAERNLQRGGLAGQVGMFQRQAAASARVQAGTAAFYESQMASAAAGWTVNVNAMQGINGDQIAAELVAGMRRRGVGGY